MLELADLLGGSLGVSRVVTSLGWRPHHEQVGQTGSRISPEVYIPCGISGAIQHWAGCASSKVILAINTDAEAPMMTKATYAVVGDMHEVVPAINEEIGAGTADGLLLPTSQVAPGSPMSGMPATCSVGGTPSSASSTSSSGSRANGTSAAAGPGAAARRRRPRSGVESDPADGVCLYA